MAVRAEYWEVLTPDGEPNEEIPLLPWDTADQAMALAVRRFGRRALGVRLRDDWYLIRHPRVY